MKSLFALLIGLLASPAIAEPVRLIPGPGETLYFERTYSPDHLAANPKQVVGRIVIEIEIDREGAEGTPQIGIRLLKVGEKRPVYSGRGLLAEHADGLRFRLDRELGTGGVVARDGYVLLTLREDDSMTLTTFDIRYEQGPDDEKLLTLSGTDPDHKTFKLYPSTLKRAEY
jgi:hypothetical protein